ncbi:hypothetical protein [Kangiella shandongensis]|uniref:hypothetical protein n=1 Tax=Kangiella shandongensis TaxID=2763258 RepID=UPI001CC198F1|nr:hypothetical protein [Kangiella shandongensis]
MSDDNELLPLSAFPKEGLWRIDYLGSLYKNQNMPSNPFIELEISRCHYRPNRNSYSVQIIDESSKKKVRVGASYLHHLEIGSIIKDQKFYQPPVSSKRIFTLDINSNTSTISAGSEITKGRYYIPPYLYRLPYSQQSKLIKVTATDDTTVLIPMLELIRFYFSSSSYMNRCLFSDEIKSKTAGIDWEKSSYLPEENIFHAFASQGANLMDVWMASRMACSKEAFSSAVRVYNSLMISHTNSDLLLPETTFPFKGRTTLITRGVNLQNGHYLALNLVQCSHSFPFDNITITWPTDGPEDEEGKGTKPYNPRRKKRGGKRQGNTNDNEEPDNDFLKSQILLFQDRFTHIRGKKPENKKKEATKYYYDGNKPPKKGEAKKGESSGKGTSGKSQNAPVDSKTSPPEITIRLNQIIEAVKISAQKFSFTANAIPVAGCKSFTIHNEYFNLFPSDNFWANNRQFVIFECNYKGKVVYLTEIQRRQVSDKMPMIIFYNQSYSYIDHIDLTSLFRELGFARMTRWHDIINRQYAYVRGLHTKKALESPQTLAERIFKKVREAAG